MPNGDHGDKYSQKWCDERHRQIRDWQTDTTERLDRLDDRLSTMAVRIAQIVGAITAAGVGVSAALQSIL